MTCQSETFLAPPWQGDANIRFLWHIGCQSDFDELVSMASRPVYRGSCRMEETKVPFHPVKRGFGRRKSISTTFRPPKGGFGRTGTPLAFIARSKGRLRTGPSFCRSGPSTVSCVLLRGNCLRRTPPTIAGAHISAPAGPCILQQQNMERQVGRQG